MMVTNVKHLVDNEQPYVEFNLDAHNEAKGFHEAEASKEVRAGLRSISSCKNYIREHKPHVQA